MHPLARAMDTMGGNSPGMPVRVKVKSSKKLYALGQRIRRRCYNVGIHSEDLAHHLGITANRVRKLFKGDFSVVNAEDDRVWKILAGFSCRCAESLRSEYKAAL